MEIKVTSTFDNAKMYLAAAKCDDAAIQELWQSHMIDPFWPEISRWAPFDQSFKQPPVITGLAALEKQLDILSGIDIGCLRSEFTKITKALPSADDDPMLAVLYPLCDNNKAVKERQNGVVGAAVFGNVIISVNPLANDWQKWIPFVFAHEYHHNIWGHNWFVLRSGQGLEGTLLEHMITEGQADMFAESLFPKLVPKWNRPFEGEADKLLWERFKPVLFSKDPSVHAKYIFGDESEGLPWCAGYSFGRAIVTGYMQKYPDTAFSELLDVTPEQIFKESRYGEI